MKNILGLLLGLLLTSCGVGFQYTALNHAGQIDGIYSSNDVVIEVPSDVQIDTLNEFQLRRKLRTDFNFRYDIAQYALSQPASFDWNNRLLGNRYNWNRPYWGYSYYWDRTQMWNDWVWGYNWYSPYQWSPFNNNWGSYSYYGWNNSWWNGYNNWYNGPWHNQGYNVIWNRSQRNNVAYINGRRGSSNIQSRVVSNNTNRTRVVTNKPRVITNKPRVVINTKPRVNNSRPIFNNSKPVINNSRPTFNNNSRPNTTIRTIPNNPTRSSSNTPTRGNSRKNN